MTSSKPPFDAILEKIFRVAAMLDFFDDAILEKNFWWPSWKKIFVAILDFGKKIFFPNVFFGGGHLGKIFLMTSAKNCENPPSWKFTKIGWARPFWILLKKIF